MLFLIYKSLCNNIALYFHWRIKLIFFLIKYIDIQCNLSSFYLASNIEKSLLSKGICIIGELYTATKQYNILLTYYL